MVSFISNDELNQIPIQNNEILRCPKCFKIQYVELFIKNNVMFCKLKCENNHKFEKPLRILFEKIHENQIENVICSLCNNEYSKIQMYYCKKQNNFLCEKCINCIDCEEKIPVDDIDICCDIHKKTNLYFCKTCSKELCTDCLINHNSHSFFEILPLNNDEIEDFQNKISIFENKIIDFQKNTNLLIELSEKFIKQLYEHKNYYLNIYNLELLYAKSLLNIYNKKKLQRKLCNPIFQNIRNLNMFFHSFEFNKNDELKNTLNEILTFFNLESNLKNSFNSSINSTTISFSNSFSSKSSNLFSEKELENYNNINNKYKTHYNNKSKIITKELNNKPNNYSFKNRKNKFTISDLKTQITALVFSNDNQLIVGDDNGYISIYSNDNYTLEKSFRPHYKCINHLFRMSNGKIISSSSDSNILIFSINNKINIQLENYLKGHKNSVYEGIEFTNGYIYSTSSDKTMRIWKKGETEIYKQNNKKTYKKEINAFIELNNDEIVGTNFYDEQIVFLNSKTLEEVYTIQNIKCGSLTSSITLIDNDLLAVGGEGLYIINIITKKFVNHIIPNIHYLKCLFYDYQTNEIIIGNEIGQILNYNINNKQFELVKEKNINKENMIYSIKKSNNGKIAISSNIIKIWEL